MTTRDTDSGERRLEQSLLEGLASGRSRLAPATFFERMHALVDRIAAEKRKKRRRDKPSPPPRDQG